MKIDCIINAEVSTLKKFLQIDNIIINNLRNLNRFNIYNCLLFKNIVIIHFIIYPISETTF